MGIGIDANNIFNDLPNSICGSLEAMLIDEGSGNGNGNESNTNQRTNVR